MGKMGKRYLVFDGRTMPVLKKKEQQTTTTKEEGTGQAKEGSAKEGSAVDKSDTGGMEVATMKSGLLPQQHFLKTLTGRFYKLRTYQCKCPKTRMPPRSTS
jgi:hypothetical protein